MSRSNVSFARRPKFWRQNSFVTRACKNETKRPRGGRRTSIVSEQLGESRIMVVYCVCTAHLPRNVGVGVAIICGVIAVACL